MVTTVSFSPNTKIKSADVNSNTNSITAVLKPTLEVGITGTLTTGTNKTLAVIVPQAMTFSICYGYVKTAPTGASVIVDIEKNGVTIWSNTANRLTIAAGAQTGNTSTFNTTTCVAGDILTFDVSQVGSGTTGSDLTIALVCTL